MNKVILGNIEVLYELVQLIQQLDDDGYCCPAPLFNHSIGCHVRHILDVYQALMRDQHNFIDYDLQRSDHEVESKRTIALKEMIEIENWLMALKEEQFSEVKIVKKEVCKSQHESMNFTSTLGRELCFASSHVTPNLALIVAIAKSMNINVSS